MRVRRRWLVPLAGTALLLATGAQEPAASSDDSEAQIALGRRLFYEADLSINGTMSCATCHEQRHAFADGNRVHPGALDDPGRRNVPGLANVGEFTRLTWADPRQTDLAGQVDVPMLGEHPVEMAMKGHADEIARRLGADPCYRSMFADAFAGEGPGIDYPRVARALAAFERTLVSHDAPWDRWRKGKDTVFSDEARSGEALFAKDCASCHAGENLTDEAYHRIEKEGASGADQGLAEVTGKPSDRGRFRTAPLRNVALTAPYLHDGSAPDLPQAIARHAGLGAYDGATMARLVAFLESLTDRRFVEAPEFGLPMEACGKAL